MSLSIPSIFIPSQSVSVTGQAGLASPPPQSPSLLHGRSVDVNWGLKELSEGTPCSCKLEAEFQAFESELNDSRNQTLLFYGITTISSLFAGYARHLPLKPAGLDALTCACTCISGLTGYCCTKAQADFERGVMATRAERINELKEMYMQLGQQLIDLYVDYTPHHSPELDGKHEGDRRSRVRAHQEKMRRIILTFQQQFQKLGKSLVGTLHLTEEESRQTLSPLSETLGAIKEEQAKTGRTHSAMYNYLMLKRNRQVSEMQEKLLKRQINEQAVRSTEQGKLLAEQQAALASLQQQFLNQQLQIVEQQSQLSRLEGDQKQREQRTTALRKRVAARPESVGAASSDPDPAIARYATQLASFRAAM